LRPNVYWVETNTKHTVATETICNPELFQFPAVKKRAVTASFTGGDVTSDGGIALLRQHGAGLVILRQAAMSVLKQGSSGESQTRMKTNESSLRHV
jgi:hypothetical protein